MVVPNRLIIYCWSFICLPRNNSFRSRLMFWWFSCETSELCLPITTKLCTMVKSVFDFTIPVQNLGEPPPKNYRGQ